MIWDCNFHFGLRVLGFLLVVILMGFTHVTEWSSSLWANIAFVNLNMELTSTNSGSLSQAERGLQRAVLLDSENSSIWRGLGFVHFIQGKKIAALQAWQEVEGIEEFLIEFGKLKYENGEIDEAIRWFEAATILAPECGDGWYFIGLIAESRQEWETAVNAYDQAIAASCYIKVGSSDVFLRRGLFWQRTPGYQDYQEALGMYDIALALDSFTSPLLKAEAFYKEGEIYDLVNHQVDKAIHAYQQALLLFPRHHWARGRLGYALYRQNHDVSGAEIQLKYALSIWPDNSTRKWPYLTLATIYQDEGRLDQAIDAYREALQIDPLDTNIQSRLKALNEE